MFIRINGQNVNSQILPVDSPTLDETLETLSFVLVSNTQSMPYAPCQEVEIVTDNLETIRFFLVSDNVEVASANPLRFKHTITCVQNTRYLSKHLVRNSVFSTPAYLTKESYNAATITLSNRTKDPDDINYGLSVRGNYRASALITVNNNIKPLNLTKLNLNFREKIKAAYIEINCQAVRCPMGQEGTELPGTGNSVWVNNLSDKNSFQSPTIGSTSNWTFGNNLILHCEKENGTVLEETINPTNLGVTAADWYPLNKKIRYARIEELASQGYVTFYIKFPAQLETFLDATVYPYRGNFWFFFMFQAKIVAETYYYNTYEILSLLRLRQQKSRLGPGVLERRQEDPLFELPAYNTELGKLLESTPAPNFTFTQNTMYECIAEVFRLFDAIFTIGQNKRLGIEYFNERNGTNVTETLKKTGQTSSSSEDKYTNGLVAYYQNAKTKETYPADNRGAEYNYSHLKSKSLGVPQEAIDFVFETPHIIDEINHCYVKLNNDNGKRIRIQSNFEFGAGGGYITLGETDQTKLMGFPILDVGHFVVNEELWTLLDTDASMYNSSHEMPDPYRLIQINTIFFKKGTNQIEINYTYKTTWLSQQKYAFDNMMNCAFWLACGATNCDDPSQGSPIGSVAAISGEWSYIEMKADYITDVDGRTKIESIDRKYDGETLIDQYNGAVDLNKMGLNILGLSLKLGNPTLNVTQKITSWDNRIKTGDIYFYEGKMWIANVVNYTIYGKGYIQANIQFVQNFNALSLRTSLLRIKRMSNISQELTVKSEDNIMEYVYFSFGSTIPTMQPTTIACSSSVLAYNIGASIGATDNDPQPLEIAEMHIYTSNVKNYIPLIKYGAGNCICFEMSYNSPISAGKQTKTYNAGWFFGQTTKYFTKIIKYTDDMGFAEEININIHKSEDVTISEDLPVITTTNPLISFSRYVALKQPNEIFALNYQITFLPLDKQKDFIGSRFINSNYFINGEMRNIKSLRFYYNDEDDDFKYSVLDRKGHGSGYIGISHITLQSLSNNVAVFKIELDETIETSAFSICDPDGEILFAANEEINTDTLYLTFAPNWKRIDDKVLEEL